MRRSKGPLIRSPGGVASRGASKRCQAGIDRAKRKGTKFGRPAVLDASQKKRIAERYSAGETMAALARQYDCSEPTIWRVLQGPFDASAAA